MGASDELKGRGVEPASLDGRGVEPSGLDGCGAEPTLSPSTPHGGRLVDRVLPAAEREQALEQARGLRRVTLGPVSVSDLELLAIGGYSPLEGFMLEADYRSVVKDMRLGSGLPWGLPVTLPVAGEEAASLREGQELALVDEGGRLLGLMVLEERYRHDREEEARLVYRTVDPAHPGVARVLAQGEVLLGGKVWLVARPPRPFAEFRHDPLECRRLFARRGWKTVAGFQTRNPIHRAHEYIQKCALEVVDGLLLHPLVGETKEGDIPAEVRMRSYRSLLRDYYPPDRVLLAIFPAAMRYAGPREAIFHAVVRKNYGCTHFIVGRDHAGVGNYYGPYDAQRIFDEFVPGELGITPLFFENAFFCRRCGSMATSKTCPHGPEDHLSLSGTQVRRMLEAGESPPREFTRPEVARVLMGLRGGAAPAGEASPAEGAAPAPPQGAAPIEDAAPAAPERAKSRPRRRLLVLGLDSLEPGLALEEWIDDLPNLKRLASGGRAGRWETTVPPITVPAWAVMTTGRDPGELGLYGFRNRSAYDYHSMGTASSASVREPAVWDWLGRAGRQVVLLGVPPAYPPRPVNGCLVSCFLTPDAGCAYTYPAELKAEIEGLVGELAFDVDEFRTEAKDRLLDDIYRMSEQRFKLIRHLVRTRDWDFFMAVEMGPDRIQHGFWKFWDAGHPRHVPGSPYRWAMREYYRYLDRELGEVLDLLDDHTSVMVVSDHGAKRMVGGVCVNEWLAREGYLGLKQRPERLAPLEKVEVDWSRTVAWGAGGYYGRVFLNVKGREPLGVVEPACYEAVRDELAARLAALGDQEGRPIGTRVYKPQEVYRECRGIPPDLIVYFGDLDWRAVGSLGHPGVHTTENDTGPDDANHARHGVYAVWRPQGPQADNGRPASLHDFVPTVLDILGLDAARDLGLEAPSGAARDLGLDRGGGPPPFLRGRVLG